MTLLVAQKTSSCNQINMVLNGTVYKFIPKHLAYAVYGYIRNKYNINRIHVIIIQIIVIFSYLFRSIPSIISSLIDLNSEKKTQNLMILKSVLEQTGDYKWSRKMILELSDEKLLKYLWKILDTSINDIIRDITCYILIEIEANHKVHFRKSILMKYGIHLETFLMMQKYSQQLTVLQGFSILTEITNKNENGRQDCHTLLLNNGRINFVKMQLNEIYLKKIMSQLDVDVLYYTSSFMSNLTLTRNNTIPYDFINIAIQIFQAIDDECIKNQNQSINETMFNVIQMLYQIYRNHHYMRKQLYEILSGDNHLLLKSILKYIKFKRCGDVRLSVFWLLREMIGDFELAMIASTRFIELVNYSITEIKQFIKCFEMTDDEICCVLAILLLINQNGGEQCYNLILDDDDMMNIICNSIQSQKTKQWMIAVRCLLQILNNCRKYLKKYVSFFVKIIHWKQGSIIAALCKWIENYHIISKNKFNRTDIRQIFNFFRNFVIMIEDKCIDEKYVIDKFNENNLIQNMITSKFITYQNNELLLNQYQLNKMTINERKLDVGRFGYDILYIITMCRDKFNVNEDRWKTIQKLATEQGFQPKFN